MWAFSFVSALALVLTTTQPQGAKPAGLTDGKDWTVVASKTDRINLKWIRASRFLMGSPGSEPGRKADEGPQRTVRITHSFWLGETPVTIGQWKAVMGTTVRQHLIDLIKDDTLHDFDGKKRTLRDFMGFRLESIDKVLANEDDKLPMYFVSWFDATEFCKQLTERERSSGRLPTGFEYTLPTEAQWEYACRAGTGTATYVGPLSELGRHAASLDKIAWYSGNSSDGYAGKGLGNPPAGPRAVGTKQPNRWGLQDMLGNIWEWCRDWYGPVNDGDVVDPLGPDTGTARVNRGGSWGSWAADERCANRAQNPPAEASAYRGFRVALSRALYH